MNDDIRARRGRSVPDLDEDERYAAFDTLQSTMPAAWAAMRQDFDDETVIVVPSISLDRTTATTGTTMQALEERALFFLLLLRQPRLRMVFVTSLPVAEPIVEYYLGLLPGVIPAHARARLTLVSVGDASPRPLSAKLLARPRLLSEIRARISNPGHSHLVPYTTTTLERDVALTLGIPVFGTDPRLAGLGTKSGCRSIFEELGVPCPVGAQDLRTTEDLVAALGRMRARRPGLSEAIAKLNDGVSGAGNALVDLRGLPAPGADAEPAGVLSRVLALQPESEGTTAAEFLSAFADSGGVVEERISGVVVTSPSVQMRALPDGTVELLSTHDQLLGGASGQSYLGCVFPADHAYAGAIAEPALRVGRHLAERGVLGRFAVDFVTVRDESGHWHAYAIELNLRKGGTTHPFLTLQFLTDGAYDGDTGVFTTPLGSAKHLVATDHFQDRRLTALRVVDLLDVVVRHRLHFDQARQVGIVFHMLSCITEVGTVGLTAVGDSPGQAWELYEQARAVLLLEADQAGLALSLPVPPAGLRP